MKRFALAAFVAALFALPAVAQAPPLNQVIYHNGQYYHNGKVVPASWFGWQEAQQIRQLQNQIQANNAAQMAALQAQMAARDAQAAADRQMFMAFLMQQQNKPAPTPPPQPPINIYLPNVPYQGPKLDPSPGTPKQDPNPGTPKQDPSPGIPKLDPSPGIPKIDLQPGTPKIDPNPGGTPKMNPNPGTVPPPVGFQRLTTQRDLPPLITLTVTRADGSTYVVPWNPPQEQWK